MAMSMNHTSHMTGSTLEASSADYVGYVFVPIVFFIGIVGNALTIRIMITKGFRSMTFSKLLIALSVSDTIVNILFPFNETFMYNMMGVDIRAVSDIGCKFFFWAYRVFTFTSSWMVVLISTERFVAVWLHVRAKSINTTRNAYIAIAIVFVVIAAYVSYWSTLSDEIIDGKCIPNIGQSAKTHIIHTLHAFGIIAMYIFGPALLLFVLNGLIVFRLVYLKKKENNKHYAGSRNREIRKASHNNRQELED